MMSNTDYIVHAEKVQTEDYQRVTNVSYLGYVDGTLAAVRRRKERNKGKIIQVGSARAAYWAAHHRRRELWIGFSAVKAIIGQKLMPGFADHYLDRI